MPKPVQYRSGSLIYFQGDTAELIYIVQSGNVSLTYQDVETGEDIRDKVQQGEFFGVKSALGRYPREENALAVQDSNLLAFTVAEFEQMAMSNIRIVMKMLKVFSNQMRRIHKQVSNLMEMETQNNEAGLFNVGEYYLKNKRFTQAKYVFSRYLTYYPSGPNAAQAAKYLETAEISLARYGNGKGPASSMGNGNASDSPAGASASGSDASKMYYDALSLTSQEKYQAAFAAFKKIIDSSTDLEYRAKSLYELGRCFFFLEKYDDCVKHFTAMITKYPKHPDLGDALYFMGQSYEKKGQQEQAITFYKKILAMTGDEDEATHIKAKRALKALEV